MLSIEINKDGEMGLFVALLLVGLYVLFNILILIDKKREARLERERADAQAKKEKEKKEEAEAIAQKENEEAEAREREVARQAFRDADAQDQPYTYEIDRHALETLAMRYGIAHQERGPDGRIRDKDTIRIQKLSALGRDRYMATLPDYRDRQVVAVIQKGEEFVRTFYPLDESWFKKNENWEDVLKGNPSWTIKDIARMHVERINALDGSQLKE